MTFRAITEFSDYQMSAKDTAIYPEVGKRSPASMSYVILGLVGESGELANKYKKVIRDSGGVLDIITRDAIEEELGDVLWYVAMLANELGIGLSAIASSNIEKLASRKERNTLQGSGDNR